MAVGAGVKQCRGNLSSRLTVQTAYGSLVAEARAGSMVPSTVGVALAKVGKMSVTGIGAKVYALEFSMMPKTRVLFTVVVTSSGRGVGARRLIAAPVIICGALVAGKVESFIGSRRRDMLSVGGVSRHCHVHLHVQTMEW